MSNAQGVRANRGIPLAKDERASSAMRHLLKSLSPLNYAITFGVVDAADYGAPQHRLRFVMMGSRDSGRIRLPERTHGMRYSTFANNPGRIPNTRLEFAGFSRWCRREEIGGPCRQRFSLMPLAVHGRLAEARQDSTGALTGIPQPLL